MLTIFWIILELPSPMAAMGHGSPLPGEDHPRWQGTGGVEAVHRLGALTPVTLATRVGLGCRTLAYNVMYIYTYVCICIVDVCYPPPAPPPPTKTMFHRLCSDQHSRNPYPFRRALHALDKLIIK